MSKFCWIISVLLCSEILAAPHEKYDEGEVLNRSIRSPTFKKKPLAFLLGGQGGGLGGGHGGGYGGGNNYVTNINNYGPHHETSHIPHVDHGHHGAGGGGSFAGSAAVAGGHGSSQAQSQSASFSFGPYSASFSQSQAQGGRGGGFFSDY